MAASGRRPPARRSACRTTGPASLRSPAWAMGRSAQMSLRVQPGRKLAEPPQRVFLFSSVLFEKAQRVVEPELEMLDADRATGVVQVAQAGIRKLLRVVLVEEPGERGASRRDRLRPGVADRLLDAGGVVFRLLEVLLER